MSFVPKTFETIRDDMISFLRTNTNVTDFEIGSVIRTIIEAVALEDDEQYFQMAQLLDAFRLTTSSGSILDDRVAEFGIRRLQAESSTGQIIIQDNNLVKDKLEVDAAVGSTTITLDDSSDFPTAGFPVNIRIGEGNLSVEDITVSANDTVNGILTLGSGLVNQHDAAERVSLVTGVADIDLSPGIRVQVPPIGTDDAIIFITTENGTIVNGNFESTSITARAEVPGSSGNIGSSLITEFASSPPFSGAEVTNKSKFGGGRELETDSDLRDRARDEIQSLTRGTTLSLSQGILGASDEVTGQRVTTANLLESFVDNEVTVYVDDGTGFTPDTIELATSTLNAAVGVGVGTITVIDSSNFPEEGFILISPEADSQRELIQYSGVDHFTHVITLSGITQNAHDLGDEVVLVDLIEDNAESGANFFQTANFPIVKSSERIWVSPNQSGVDFTIQVSDTDYILNTGTGQLEFTGSGLTAGSQVIAEYTFFTGLIASVQKIIDGDPNDPTNFPGLRCAGSKVLVDVPVIRRITININLTAASGSQQTNLIGLVSSVLTAYINGLGIGEDVILNEIRERAMAVNGVFDVSVSTPTSNITVLENELPVSVDANGSSLITVT